MKTESEGPISNYDQNAVNNRITQYCLQSEQVPDIRAPGDRPHYFIGSMHNQQLVV